MVVHFNRKPHNPFRTPPKVDEDFIISHPIFQIVYCATVSSLLVAIAVVSFYSSSNNVFRPHHIPNSPQRQPRLFSSMLQRSPGVRGYVPSLSNTGSMILREGKETSSVTAGDDDDLDWADDRTSRFEHVRLHHVLQQEKTELVADDVYDEFGLLGRSGLENKDDDNDDDTSWGVHVVERHHHRRGHGNGESNMPHKHHNGVYGNLRREEEDEEDSIMMDQR